MAGKPGETRLITPEPSLNFTYQAALIWNVAREVLQLDDFSKSLPKTAIKNKLLKSQAEGDPIEWELILVLTNTF